MSRPRNRKGASRIAVYAALTANVGIAVTKFAVAGLTGSSAMLSEGIHSAVDTINSVLLLLGMKLSQRKATQAHPFGHGKDVYFWSLTVAVLIFGIGGGVSAYEGVIRILNPQPLRDPGWNYAALAVAAVFEGTSLGVALRQFQKLNRDIPFWKALQQSRDPGIYTVFAEDSTALAGIAVAALGIYASVVFDMPEIDAAASIVIALLLGGVAVLLIRKSRGLLIGEGVLPETAVAIHRLALATPGIRSAARPLSMYVGVDDVLLAFDVQFESKVSAARVANRVAKLEESIRSRYPKIKRIYIEVRREVS